MEKSGLSMYAKASHPEPNGHATILESSGIGYSSLHLLPKDLSLFASDLSLKIIEQLAQKPQCTMDISRALNEHEQKIYYHIRKLERAGLIQVIAREQRLSMTAKIYKLVAPAIHTTLNRADFHVPKERPKADQRIIEFLKPFVENGKLNALIVIGSPSPHGEMTEPGKDASYVADLIAFLSRFADITAYPCYKFDTQVTSDDLKNNLIVIGSPRHNTLTQKLNGHLPIHFDEKKEWSIVSGKTGVVHDDVATGTVMRTKNPFNNEKHILLLAGKRARGTRAAIIAFTQHTEAFINDSAEPQCKVMQGLDRDSDYEIDDIKLVE